MKNYKEKLNKILNLENYLIDFKKGKKQIKKGVFVGKNVTIEPYVFFDSSKGMIIIGDKTQIKGGAVLRGPLLIGENCKIGGEIQHSIFENFSNKQHYGYVGYSYIGSWVNIGGGTSIATLKNSYNSVKMGGIDTGAQFLGAILGDYVKTAINTSIFCGKIIGESAHLYGMVTEDVPAFTSHVSAGVMYELPLEIAEKIQKAMMKRRGLNFLAKDHKNFEKLFSETASGRKKAKVKKSKLKFN